MNPPGIDDYQPDQDTLADRAILITGAGAGIGRALALACARYGAQVILLGRTVSKLEAAYDEITTAGGPEPTIAPLDLANAQAPAYFELAKSIEKEFGRLDGLVHNAGILGQRSPIEHYDMKTWHQVLHVNLTAPFALTQVLLPNLRASADASVVFVSSGVGRQGRAFWGGYAVSKFGLEGLSQVLADECEGNSSIRVNTINPGRTRTAMRAAAYPAEDPDTLPVPEDILNPFVYLLGPDSQGITGQRLDCQA